jgi:membrane-associated phospholipid phosphatase
MSPRSITLATALAIALSIISILFFDRPVAELVHQLGGEHSKVLTTGTTGLERVFGITLSKFALGFVLIIVGLALFAWKAKRHIAWVLLFIGCTHFTARLVTGVLKEVFHRLRPYEVLPIGAWDNQFFSAHGGAFPSGHTTHFWALFFPLAFLFPRLRVPLLILPIFIAVARVGLNDHWLSDVFASIAICGMVTLLFIWAFRWKQVVETHTTLNTG